MYTRHYGSVKDLLTKDIIDLDPAVRRPSPLSKQGTHLTNPVNCRTLPARLDQIPGQLAVPLPWGHHHVFARAIHSRHGHARDRR